MINTVKLTDLLKEKVKFGRATITAEEYINALDEQEITEEDLTKSKFEIERPKEAISLQALTEILKRNLDAELEVEFSIYQDERYKLPVTTWSIIFVSNCPELEFHLNG